MFQDFNTLNLPEKLQNSLNRLEFKTPTPIQSQVIPQALEGADILGSAQTGTGKTGAFGIPLCARLMSSKTGTALIMAPTRELAMQVVAVLRTFLGGKNSDVKSVLLIGGESITKQLQQLRAKPRLIVGTPGRINDHLDRGTLDLSDTRFLVLDETDRMLDMGFEPQIDRIIKLIPTERQTLLFSATLPKNIVSISKKFLNNPVRVSVDGDIMKPAENLKQEVLHIASDAKYSTLLEEVKKREGSIIVFVKTKMNADRIAGKLQADGEEAEAIHGDLTHNKRTRAMSGFQSSKFRIMVATDIAARGLHVSHVKHVINYDLPQSNEDYIHRIGRTARAGAEGSSLCLVTPAEKSRWNEIDRFVKGENGQESAPPQPQQRRNSGRPQGRGGFKSEGGNGRGRGFGGGSRGDSRSERPRSSGFGSRRPSNRDDADSSEGKKPSRFSFGFKAPSFFSSEKKSGNRTERFSSEVASPRSRGEGFGSEGRSPRSGFGSRDGRPSRPRGEGFSSEGRAPRSRGEGFGSEGRPARSGFGSRDGRPSRPRSEGFGSEGRAPRPRGEGFGSEGRPARSGFGSRDRSFSSPDGNKRRSDSGFRRGPGGSGAPKRSGGRSRTPGQKGGFFSKITSFMGS